MEYRYEPRKNIKAGHHRPSNEMPFESCFAGGPMMARHCVLTQGIRANY